MSFNHLFADIFAITFDTQLNRNLRQVLQAAGYSFHSTNNPLQALSVINNQPPQLLIITSSPEECQSPDLIRQVKNNPALPFIPIIFVANGSSQELSSALAAGADDFLSQPVENANLLMRTRAMLRLKAASDELQTLNATLEQKVFERSAQLEQAHNQLAHAEKLSSLGRLAASIAHEINNPLAAIGGYLDLIQNQIPADSPLQQDIEVISEQVKIISGLASDLRDFSRPPRKERFPVQLNTIVEDVVKLTGKELERSKVQTDIRLSPHTQPVLASAAQLSEVILNLIMNARDAMQSGGTLKIFSGPYQDCSWVQISDTGSGIDPNNIERIFEPFFTTKGERGTGLGLSITYSIIQDHGGHIAVRSAPGQGTAFRLHVPGIDKSQQNITCTVCAIHSECLAWRDIIELK